VCVVCVVCVCVVCVCCVCSSLRFVDWERVCAGVDFRFVRASARRPKRRRVPTTTTTTTKDCTNGSLAELERVLDLALEYDLRVLLDLHAAPESQNGAFWPSPVRQPVRTSTSKKKQLPSSVCFVARLRQQRLDARRHLGRTGRSRARAQPALGRQRRYARLHDAAARAADRRTSRPPGRLGVRIIEFAAWARGCRCRCPTACRHHVCAVWSVKHSSSLASSRRLRVRARRLCESD